MKFPVIIICIIMSVPVYGRNMTGIEEIIPISKVKDYAERFNRTDNELYVQLIPNCDAAEFLARNIPRFECPDRCIEEIYYFRWWTFRKHIRQTPDGYVITEFLPDVPWAGKYNAISCPAMHHFNECRWLHDRRYLDSYLRYWLRGGGSLRKYSFPVAHSMYSYYLATGDGQLIREYLPDVIANFEAWETERFDARRGLFRQSDWDDGMEISVCGRETVDGYRVTINSYMTAEAQTIARIARRFEDPSAGIFAEKARALHSRMLATLWDAEAQFFKVIPRKNSFEMCDARELHGYTPWLYDLAGEEYASAWKFVMDSAHFYAPFGLTTVERCHPRFRVSYEGHECQWNGPSWPFATSVTLTAMASLLNSQNQAFVSVGNWFELFGIFAHSHYLTGENGLKIPWIDENLNPFTGDWIARTRLKTWNSGAWPEEKGGTERGKDYNHSTFCDLVITGLAGIRPEEGDCLTVNPLVPAGEWDYFCLDGVSYHGHRLTVLYDLTGKHYGRGYGLHVFVDGRPAGSRPDLGAVRICVRDM